ncbi:MAG: hypothetical protein EHM19_11540, partial [Candidatus Latescibacterota bacterium]
MGRRRDKRDLSSLPDEGRELLRKAAERGRLHSEEVDELASSGKLEEGDLENFLDAADALALPIEEGGEREPPAEKPRSSP